MSENDGQDARFERDETDEHEAVPQGTAAAEEGRGEEIPPFVLPRVKEVRRLGAP